MLDVYLHDRFVGTLAQKDSGNLQFRYDADYITAGGPPLSLSMPIRAEAYPHRACLAFFGNLLPEEDVRAQVALATGISKSSDYQLLKRFGGDVAGAITIRATDEEERAAEPNTLQDLSPGQLDDLLVKLPQRPLAADEQGEVRLSLAGAQNKLPVVQVPDGYAIPHGSGLPTTHILKPEPQHLEGLVANEFFCMRLAEQVDLPVARVNRATTLSGLPFLIVERYDRDLTQDPIRRLHQEDICQALGKLQAEKYQEEGGPTVGDVFALISASSSAPARDRPQLWSALVFNVLIGNCDAHGKNYSLLYDSSAPILAPLYDLVSTVVYEGLSTRLAMSVDGAKKLDEVRRHAWDQLATEVGVAPRYVEQRMAPFVNQVVAAAQALAEQTEHDHSIVTKIVAGIERRAQQCLS